MRRQLLLVGMMSFISFTVSAQQDNNKIPFPQQMQQKLNQAYQSAANEFNKNYTQPQSDSSSNGKTPPVTQQPAPPPPVVAQPEPQPQQQANPVPDVAVSSEKKSETSSSVGNIYAPGGGSTPDNSNGGTINPYR